MIEVKVIAFDQPAGSFLLGVMRADDVLKIANINRRKLDEATLISDGLNREPSKKRIKEIAEYAYTIDAAFPSTVLLALNKDTYELEDELVIIKEEKCTDVVDGQHRLLGLEKSGQADKFVIPVVFIIEPTEEQKALIFATINGKQTKVPASIIYDLFGVTVGRSPQKTAHEIARALNSMPESPWYRRLKMLGKKISPVSFLSQGTFVKELLPHISSQPDEDLSLARKGEPLPERERSIFNRYFLNNKDEIILKILLNLFTAAQKCWLEEWNNPEKYILTKSVGYVGLMKALPFLYNNGISNNALSESFFLEIFSRAKDEMHRQQIELTSEHFPSSSAGASVLTDIIKNSLKIID